MASFSIETPRSNGESKGSKGKTWMVLLASDDYIVGVLTLACSLRKVGSVFPLTVLTTPDISTEIKDILSAHDLEHIDCQFLFPPEHNMPELGIERFVKCWPKIHAFDFVQYSRIGFLDADILILKNIDDLLADLQIPEGWIAAVQDCKCEHHKLNPPIEVERGVCPYKGHTSAGPAFKLRFQSARLQHCFLASFYVFEPSHETYDALLNVLANDPIVKDFRAPEQDLYVHHFRFRWISLPYTYQAVKMLEEWHPELFKIDEVKSIHYSYDKPWEERPKPGQRWEMQHNLWWRDYDELVRKEPELVRMVPKAYLAKEIREKFTYETGKP